MKKILIAEIVILVLLIGVAAWLVIGAQEPGADVPALQTDITPTVSEQTAPSTEQTAASTEPLPSEEVTLPPETTQPVETTEQTLPPETTQPLVSITWKTFPEDREITSTKYFVYDVDADSFITSKGSGQRVYPASVTKLFTCYVGVQFLSPDTVVTVGDEITLIDWDSSRAGLLQGDQLTVEQLVEGLLLPSGNDAAYVLATNAGRVILDDPEAGYKDAVNAFVEEMNRQAAQVGMIGSHFMNPDGIHNDNHYMCVEDLALLGKLSVQTPAIANAARIISDRVKFIHTADRGEDAEQYGIDDEGYMNWKNTNHLLNPAQEYYCPYATGLKTGFTNAAGSCLLSSFQVEGRTLIIGAFGGIDRMDDTLQLLNEALQ